MPQLKLNHMISVEEAISLALKYAKAIADGKVEAHTVAAMTVDEALAFGDTIEDESKDLQNRLEDIVEQNTKPAWAGTGVKKEGQE
jgi:hypothetical protein